MEILIQGWVLDTNEYLYQHHYWSLERSWISLNSLNNHNASYCCNSGIWHELGAKQEKKYVSLVTERIEVSNQHQASECLYWHIENPNSGNGTERNNTGAVIYEWISGAK